MAELVTVRVGDCACPDLPHPEGDEVYLLPKLSLAAGLEAQKENAAALTEAIRKVLGPKPSEAKLDQIKDETSPMGNRVAVIATDLLIERWKPIFVKHGAVGWNLWNEKTARPFDVDELLGDFALSFKVADAAADLYAPALMRPLQEVPETPSPPSSTEDTPKATPPKPRSTRTRRSSSSRAASVGQQSVTSP